MSVPSEMSASAAVARYQAVRNRLPSATFSNTSITINNLTDLIDNIDVFVLDGFGVLNVGEAAVPGAVEHVARLQDAGKIVKVITNGAGRPVAQTFSKYIGWGYNFDLDDVISSRDVLEAALKNEKQPFTWGFMARGGAEIDTVATHSLWLADEPALYDKVDGFALLSSGEWNACRHELMQNSLQKKPRPVVVGNPDLVAPHDGGFSIEPGLYAHALADATGIQPVFYGKPFQNVFTMMEQRIGVRDKKRIAMVGDTLHTDILGGAAAGWSTVLITDHGLLKGMDIEATIKQSGIRPDYIASTT